MLKATAVRSPWFMCLKSGSQLACQAPGALPCVDTIHGGHGSKGHMRAHQGGGGDMGEGEHGGGGVDRDIWPRLPLPQYHQVLAQKGLCTNSISSSMACLKVTNAWNSSGLTVADSIYSQAKGPSMSSERPCILKAKHVQIEKKLTGFAGGSGPLRGTLALVADTRPSVFAGCCQATRS